MSQDSRVAFVTGSARGIGLAVAEEFLGHGCRVAIADKDIEEARASAARLDATGEQVLALELDVTLSTSVDQAIAATIGKFGRLDALVNNAGTINPEPSESISDESWSALLGVHLDGTFRCCRAALPRAEGVSLGRDRQHLVDCGQGRHPETTVVQRCQGRNRGSDACPCRGVGRRRNPDQRGRSGLHDDQEDGGDDRLGVARRVAGDETDPTPTLCPPRGDRTGRLFPRIPGVELRDGPNLVRRRRRGREQPLVGARPVEPP